MNIVFIEPKNRLSLYPLNLAKPNAELRMGAFTFSERLAHLFPSTRGSYDSPIYLSEKFPMHIEDENWFINPLFLPNNMIVKSIVELRKGEALFFEKELVAFRGSFGQYSENRFDIISQFEMDLVLITKPWHFFQWNEAFLDFDFQILKNIKKFQTIPSQVAVTGEKENIFIEEGAYLEHCILNTLEGAIYISKGATIKEGVMCRGTTYIGPNASLNMGAKIYGASTIGLYCKVGGELNNSILMQYSNKGHEGFLGNSVVGEWCNLGADTNNSNLKNTYSNVELWSVEERKYVDTGLQFCGLIMGDHSKSAINTQFNTGTIVGFSANIFTEGFPPKNITSFSFGGKKSSPKVHLDSAKTTAQKMMERRKVPFSKADDSIFDYLYENI